MFCTSFSFPKWSNNYKIQDSSKIYHISFSFSFTGPVSLVRLQATSTSSAGNLISMSHYTFTVPRWTLGEMDVAGDELQRNENEKHWRRHTLHHLCYFVIIHRSTTANGRENRMKTCKLKIDIQYLVRSCSKNIGRSLTNLPWRRIALLAAAELRPTRIWCCYKYIQNGLSI